VVDLQNLKEFQYKLVSCICNWKIFHEECLYKPSFTLSSDLVSVGNFEPEHPENLDSQGYFVEANSIFQSDLLSSMDKF
jgi:hypothetical protein